MSSNTNALTIKARALRDRESGPPPSDNGQWEPPASLAYHSCPYGLMCASVRVTSSTAGLDVLQEDHHYGSTAVPKW